MAAMKALTNNSQGRYAC